VDHPATFTGFPNTIGFATLRPRAGQYGKHIGPLCVLAWLAARAREGRQRYRATH